MPGMLSEEWIQGAVSVLVRLVETAAALIIFCGAALAFGRFLVAVVRRTGAASFHTIRLSLGQFLALGLEFQLGADLLRTAVAPTWEQIGQLAAVAAIRTALNYFLTVEIRQELQRPKEPGRPVRPREPRPEPVAQEPHHPVHDA